jgi:hypothetical protein
MLPSVIGSIESLRRLAAMCVAYDACRRSTTGLNHRGGA